MTGSTGGAEALLGIPASVYWYVASPHAMYTGGAISLWDPDDLANAEGGVCPFDTGGLASRFVVPEPPLGNDAEIVAYFRQCDCQLTTWPQTVVDAIDTSYVDVGQYVAGYAPDPPMTPRDHSANASSQSWIWESRIAKADSPYSRASLVRIIWPEERRRRFFAWLALQPFTDKDLNCILARLDGAQETVTDDLVEAARAGCVLP